MYSTVLPFFVYQIFTNWDKNIVVDFSSGTCRTLKKLTILGNLSYSYGTIGVLLLITNSQPAGVL